MTHDRFAAAVGRWLFRWGEADPGPSANTFTSSGTHVVVAPQHEATETARAMGWLAPGGSVSERPWLFAAQTDRFVIVSPLFMPGRPCAACYDRRWLTNPPSGRKTEQELALRRAIDTGATFGFTPPLAAATAALIIQRIGRPNEASEAGAFEMIDVRSGSVMDGKVRSLHGCDCRYDGSAGDADRFITPLLKEAPRWQAQR